MAEVSYLVICDYVFPAMGGKPCLIGIYETIAVEAFPHTHPSLFVAAHISDAGAPGQMFPFRIEIARPSGERIGHALDTALPLNEHGGLFLQLQIGNIIFPDAARYIVKLSSGPRTLKSYSFYLQNQPARPQSSGQIH
jgi:hypothetical protein